MRLLKQFAIVAALAIVPSAATYAQTPKALFYMTENAAGVHSFEAHRDKIDELVPAWYSVDKTGLVTGEPDPVVLREAKAAKVTVIPIVALFDYKQAHILFGDQHAQDEMNQALLRECKENGYAGFQFDIEDVMWTDRDGLSALVAKTAAVLHANGLQVQIATVPNAPGHAGSTAFGKWIFEEWRGGYDLAALAKSVDLICLMTYDQHTRWTEPGPVGGWIWTTENLDYALKMVPASKLSLGIALYGYHWFTGDPGLDKDEKTPHPQAEYISAANSQWLRDTYGGQQQWDPVDHVAWFWFYRDQMREWIFYTEKRGFADRYQLTKERGLQGFCSWVLGEEDPAIWDVLPVVRR